MSKNTATVRYILFCSFFALGAGAIAFSLLTPEILNYCRNKELVKQINITNEKIKSLTDQYESQIQLIKNEPNILTRLRTVTLGQSPESSDTAYPKLSNQQLTAAAKAILSEPSAPLSQPKGPEWIQRCAKKNAAITLFFAGAGLIIVAFVFFTAPATTK